MNPFNKVTMSSRVAPKLKAALEEEAKELDITSSLYIEELLQKRSAIAQLETFADENKRLRFENEKLYKQIAQKENENADLKNFNDFYRHSHDWILIQLEDLQKLYPNLNFQQLLIVSVGTILENEKSNFTMKKIKDFLTTKPNFFKQIFTQL